MARRAKAAAVQKPTSREAWELLLALADADKTLDRGCNGDHWELLHVLDSARVNADDTLDASVPYGDEYCRIALGSIQMDNDQCKNHPATRDWLFAHGAGW